MRTIRLLIAGLAVGLSFGAANAAGLGELKPTTPGIGLEVSGSALEMFGPRTWAAASRETEETGLRYDAAYRVGTGLLLADWHPGGSGFRLSGGLAYSNQRSDVSSPSRSSIGIGGNDPVSIYGTLDGRLRYATPSPYLGLGWGISPSRKSGLYFTADVGVMYQRPHSSYLGCSSLSSACSLLATDLREEAELRSAIEDFRFLPVVTFGVGLRF
jgi:hypothetical protein